MADLESKLVKIESALGGDTPAPDVDDKLGWHLDYIESLIEGSSPEPTHPLNDFDGLKNLLEDIKAICNNPKIILDFDLNYKVAFDDSAFYSNGPVQLCVITDAETGDATAYTRFYYGPDYYEGPGQGVTPQHVSGSIRVRFLKDEQ